MTCSINTFIPQKAKDAGLHITVHAAESGPPEHVKEVSKMSYKNNCM